MPRLPSADSLGGLSGGGGGRSISSIDASGIGSAQREQGQALQGVGDKLQAIANDINEKQGTLEDAKARADWTISRAKLEEERDNETDPEALGQFQSKYQAALTKSASMISDPRKRELFLANNSPEVARGQIAATGRADEINTDASLADTNQKLFDLRQSALKTKDPSVRAAAFKTARDLYDTLENNGDISAVDAQKGRQSWATDFATSAVNMMPPEEQLRVLGGFKGALAQQESSGNPKIVNGNGYAGLYQFGAPRLQTLGVYQPGAGENLQTWSQTGSAEPGKWSGQFNIPGFPGVKTLADFRSNPAAQDAVFGIHTAKLDQEIADRGLDKYIGKTVAGIPITREGIYAMAHLGGIGGAEAALKSGGSSDARDNNGSSVLSYARLGLTDPRNKTLVDMIPADRADYMRENAQRAVTQQTREEVAQVRSLRQDDEASIMQTGQPVQSLTMERVAASQGPEEAAAFADNRQRAQTYYRATNDWDSLPAEEINQRLASLKPRAGEEGYERQQAFFNTAVEKAQQTLKQRQEDPATAVDRLPDVQQAKQAADPKDPSSIAALGRARMVAQDRIGVPPQLQTPITRAEAINAMLPLTKAPPGLEKQGMEAVVKQFDQTYGPDAEKALTYALTASKVDNDVAEQASKVIRSIAQGRAVSAAQERALNDAIEISAANGTVSFLAPQEDTAAFSDPMTGFAAPTTKPTAKTGVYSNTPPQDIQAALGQVPTQARDALLGNPDLAKDFDAKYGRGQPLSKWVLAKHQGMLERTRETNRADGFSSLPAEGGTVPRQDGTQHSAPRLPYAR